MFQSIFEKKVNQMVLKVYLPHKEIILLIFLKYIIVINKKNKNCRMQNEFTFFKVLFQHVLIFVCSVEPSQLDLDQLCFC